jgi:hypothetical protein
MGLVVGREDYTHNVLVWSLERGLGVISREEVRVLDNTDDVVRIVNHAVDEGALTTESDFARIEPMSAPELEAKSDSEADEGYETDEDYIPTATAAARTAGEVPRRSSRLRNKLEQVHYLSEAEAAGIKGLNVCFTLEKLLPASGRTLKCF